MTLIQNEKVIANVKKEQTLFTLNLDTSNQVMSTRIIVINEKNHLTYLISQKKNKFKSNINN